MGYWNGGMSSDNPDFRRLEQRFQLLSAAMNPTDKLIAGVLLQVQEFIRSSGANQDFLTMENDDLIKLAKGMGITVCR